jgi:FixJ family two-component response regulator
MIFKSRSAGHFWEERLRWTSAGSRVRKAGLVTGFGYFPSSTMIRLFAATSKFLRSHGYTVQAYSSAEHFLQSDGLNDTSCVITDLPMPGMSGLELLTMMRAQGYGVPFIFMTAFPDETTRARALREGAICSLSKPFAGPTLINCFGVSPEGRQREEDT